MVAVVLVFRLVVMVKFMVVIRLYSGQVHGCYKAVFRVMVAVVLVFRLVVMVKFLGVIRLYSGSWLR